MGGRSRLQTQFLWSVESGVPDGLLGASWSRDLGVEPVEVGLCSRGLYSQCTPDDLVNSIFQG